MMAQVAHQTIIIESLLHRDQFDDWVGGGRLESDGAAQRWEAYDSGCGHGWQIEPVREDRDWCGMTDLEFEAAMRAIETALCAHTFEYQF